MVVLGHKARLNKVDRSRKDEIIVEFHKLAFNEKEKERNMNSM